jgi:hypothetical protein
MPFIKGNVPWNKGKSLSQKHIRNIKNGKLVQRKFVDIRKMMNKRQNK